MTFIGAAIGGVTAIAGGYMAYKGATDAADTQAQAARDANQVTWDMYQQTRADRAPWMEAAKPALASLPGMIEEGPGDFFASPEYEFVLGEGERAKNRYAASRGKYFAGGTGRALQRYAAGLGSMEHQRFVDNWVRTKLNPTQSLAGVGLTAASGIGAAGMEAAGMMGENLQTAGAARASGYMNQANIVNQTLQGVGDMAAMAWQNRPNQTIQDVPTIYSGVNKVPGGGYGTGIG